MSKEQFVEEVSKLPGVGAKKAEALYDAGYTSLEELKNASVEDLSKVEGIGPKIAEAIKAGLEEAAAPAEKQAVKVVEEAGKEDETEIVEAAERVYRVKIKPELSDEMRAALAIRADRQRREPGFKKYHWFRYSKLSDAWRRPDGELNKQRRGFNYRPPRVKVGYGKPALARGLHPSGFEEVLVHNVDELVSVDAKTQAVRIGGTVGRRKRRAIVEKAGEMNVRVLNPGVL